MDLYSKLESFFHSNELLNESYFQGLIKVYNEINNNAVPCLKAQIKLSKFEKAVIVLFFRIHNIVSSCVKLNSVSDVQILIASLRIIFELYIDLYYLTDDEVCLTKFNNFKLIEKYYAAKIIYDNDSNCDVVYKNFIKETDVKSILSIYNNGKRPYHWTGINQLRDRIKQINNKDDLNFFHYWNALLNWNIHSGSVIFDDYNIEFSRRIYSFSLIYIHKYYIDSFIFISKIFHFAKVYKDFDTIMEKLENAVAYIISKKIMSD